MNGLSSIKGVDCHQREREQAKFQRRVEVNPNTEHGQNQTSDFGSGALGIYGEEPVLLRWKSSVTVRH